MSGSYDLILIRLYYLINQMLTSLTFFFYVRIWRCEMKMNLDREQQHLAQHIRNGECLQVDLLYIKRCSIMCCLLFQLCCIFFYLYCVNLYLQISFCNLYFFFFYRRHIYFICIPFHLLYEENIPI